MAEGRMLKKNISQSNKLAKLSSDGNRLLYTWLIPFLDIEGRMVADPQYIKSVVVPRLRNFTTKRVEKALEELHEIGLLYLYEANNDRFLELARFKDFQQLRETHEAPTSIPTPIQEDYSRTTAEIKLNQTKLNKTNIATPKGVATFFTLIKTSFLNAYKERFGELPAIDFGKDGRVVKKAEGLFKDISRAYKLVDDFLVSQKAEELGYTLSICFSSHTINSWKAGKLKKSQSILEEEKRKTAENLARKKREQEIVEEKRQAEEKKKYDTPEERAKREIELEKIRKRLKKTPIAKKM